MRTLSSWSSQRCVSFAACAATKRRQSSHAKPISHPAAAPLSDEALLLPKTTILPYASPLIGIHDLKEKGRGIIAESGVSAGTLLLIARPAAIITGPPGSDLDTDELSQAIKDSGERNSSLSLLFDGSKDMSQRAIPSLAQIAKLETPQHQLQQDLDVAALVRLNAYGEPYGDISGWSLRGQGSEFCSFLGLWPAFALLNHSCWPNASTMVLKSKDELLMLVRASREIEKGEEITIAYGDVCRPLGERRSHLMSAYGFECRCERCQREEELTLAEPEVIHHLLMACEELAGPLAESTNEALTPCDETEVLEEVNADDEHVTIEAETVARIKAITLSTHAAIWMSGKDQHSYLSSWLYKAYELISMICVGNELQVPLLQQPKERTNKVKKGEIRGQGAKRTGLGGLRRRLAIMSRAEDSAASRAVRQAYAHHLDLLDSIQARHGMLHSVCRGSYQEAALSARLMTMTREIYGLESEEAQAALEKCLGSTMARYGLLKAETVAKIASAHDDNDLEI